MTLPYPKRREISTASGKQPTHQLAQKTLEK